MKKNFFKKLSFVTAFALVATAVAPAGLVSAATTPNLAERYATVYEGASRSYAVKNATGYTVKWTVSGEGAEYASLTKTSGAKTALSVDTEGELAAKNANVTVRANFYKDGKLVKSAGDVVTVKVNATALDITTDAKVELVPAGETVDFNRKITPANATSVTYWSVTDKDGKATTDATIDGAGNFKATKVGEYIVVAEAKNAKDGVVKATDSQAVKVVVNMTSATQTTDKAVKAIFTTSVKDVVTKENFKLTVKDAAGTVVPISKVSFSEDGKEVTIDTFTSLKDDTHYVLTFTAGENVQSEEFHATIGAVTDIVIGPATATAGVETAVTVKFTNAAGVDITNTILASAYSMDVEVQNGYFDTTSKKILLLAAGNTAKVKVTLFATEFDTTTGAKLNELVKEGTITAVAASATTYGAYDKYTVATSAPSDWATATTKNQVSLSDTTMKLFVSAKDSAGNALDTTTTTGGFTYTSADTSKLIVNNGNELVPVAEGLVYVVAKNADKKIEWSIPVYVVAARKATAASLSKYSVSLSNAVVNSATTEFTIKDQFQADMAVAISTTLTDISVLAKPSSVTEADAKAIIVGAISGDEITVNGLGLTAGTYRYVVKGTTANGSLTQVFTIVVQAPTGSVVTYDLVLSETAVDTTVTSTSTDLPSIDARIAQYTGGVISGYTTGSITVYKPDNTTLLTGTTTAASPATSAAPVVIDTDTNAPASPSVKLAAGTYKVVATVGTKTFTKYFTVTDKQATFPTLTVKDIAVSAGTLSSMLTTAIEVKDADGNLLAITDVQAKPTGTVLGSTFTAGNSVFVEKVAVSYTLGSVTFKCWLTVNTTITAE
jgi:hypothetical protein